MRKRASIVGALAALVPAHAQDRLPRRDVIEVPAQGEGLCVSNLFQSNMVLQRDAPIEVWGWAAPGEAVQVSFAGSEAKATAAADRGWRVQLPAQPLAIEPQTMTVRGAEAALRLENILVGDVWVLGGQSNMEFPLERVDNGWLEIVSARFDGIRVLTVPAPQGPDERRGFPRLFEWSDWFGRHFRKGDWDVLSPEIAVDLSAIGYVFARRIHMASQVPIGIIDASRGGTTVETWTPEPVLRAMPGEEVRGLLADWDQRVEAWDAQADLERRVRQHEQRVAQREERGEPIPEDWAVPDDLRPGPIADQNRPGNCYRTMIAPLEGLAVKGVIFHQGYNNALGGGSRGAALYRDVFPEMIAAWRKAFRNPKLPFGIVSLCTDGDRQDRDNFCERMLDDGVLIREAQYQTFVDAAREGDAQIGFASSFDKRRSWYHPQQKVPVGERISRWALATQYGLDRRIKWRPPVLESMEVEEGRLVLRFDQAVAAEDVKDDIRGFAIAGEDRRFHPARAEYLVVGRDDRNREQRDRKALVLTSAMVSAPQHFRYAWARNPMANLQTANHSDLPFATQRSDNWPMEQVPLGIVDPDQIQDGKLSRPQRNALRKALAAQDLARRLAEARALLREHGGGDGR